MAELIVIGYPDETTAAEAEKQARHLADELLIQPDAIAAIVRRKDGTFQVTTNHHAVGAGATWGMFWSVFFGLLLFVPVLGMAIGAGLGTLFGKLEQAGIDKEFTGEAYPAEGTRIGFLPQDPRLDPSKDVLGNVEEAVAKTRAFLKRFDELNEKMAGELSEAESEKLMAEYQKVQDAIVGVKTIVLRLPISARIDSAMVDRWRLIATPSSEATKSPAITLHRLKSGRIPSRIALGRTSHPSETASSNEYEYKIPSG